MNRGIGKGLNFDTLLGNGIFSQADRMKTMMTNFSIRTEGKCLTLITDENHIYYLYTSNCDDCVSIHEGKSDRRHVTFEGDNSIANDKSYYDPFYNDCLDPKIHQEEYKYLKSKRII